MFPQQWQFKGSKDSTQCGREYPFWKDILPLSLFTEGEVEVWDSNSGPCSVLRVQDSTANRHCLSLERVWGKGRRGIQSTRWDLVSWMTEHLRSLCLAGPHCPARQGPTALECGGKGPKGRKDEWALLLSRYEVRGKGGRNLHPMCIWASRVLPSGLAGHGAVSGSQSGARAETVVKGAGAGAAHPEAETGMPPWPPRSMGSPPPPLLALAHLPLRYTASCSRPGAGWFVGLFLIREELLSCVKDSI